MLKESDTANAINRYTGGVCVNAAKAAAFNSLLNWRTVKNRLT